VKRSNTIKRENERAKMYAEKGGTNTLNGGTKRGGDRPRKGNSAGSGVGVHVAQKRNGGIWIGSRKVEGGRGKKGKNGRKKKPRKRSFNHTCQVLTLGGEAAENSDRVSIGGKKKKAGFGPHKKST